MYIGYADTYNHTLKYATNTSGSWVISSVTSTDLVTEQSMALDKNNKLQFGYSGYIYPGNPGAGLKYIQAN